MDKKKKIIVTGGAGFIGSNLVKALNTLGRKDIIIVDNLTNDQKWKNLSLLHFESYLDHISFLHKAEEDKLPQIEAIFHLGAHTDTTETNEDYLLSNNTFYSKSLFDFCNRTGNRLIYASSAATYGNGESGYSEEQTDLSPLNCYGYSKHLFD